MDFVCKNRQQCLFQSMVCDGIIQCRDGSDEDPEFAGCCESGVLERLGGWATLGTCLHPVFRSPQRVQICLF